VLLATFTLPTQTAFSATINADIVSGASALTDTAYSPNPILADVGDTVTWTNGDSTAHTITSGTGPNDPNSGQEFNSSPNLDPLVIPSGTFSHTFNEAGEFPYYCILHPNMVGTVIVGAAPSSFISIDDASSTEGDSGTKDLNFTVTRSGDTSGESTVDFATADGTATAGSDYVTNSGTLTFTAGQTLKTVSVAVNGNTAIESDVAFSVNLSNCVGCSITDSEGVGTIVNDESAIANSILINELELNPPGGGQGGDNNSTDGVMEQIELFNPTSDPIDVSNWNAQTLHGIKETITIPVNTVIPSNGYLLVGQDSQWLDNVNETVFLF